MLLASDDRTTEESLSATSFKANNRQSSQRSPGFSTGHQVRMPRGLVPAAVGAAGHCSRSPRAVLPPRSLPRVAARCQAVTGGRRCWRSGRCSAGHAGGRAGGDLGFWRRPAATSLGPVGAAFSFLVLLVSRVAQPNVDVKLALFILRIHTCCGAPRSGRAGLAGRLVSLRGTLHVGGVLWRREYDRRG